MSSPRRVKPSGVSMSEPYSSVISVVWTGLPSNIARPVWPERAFFRATPSG